MVVGNVLKACIDMYAKRIHNSPMETDLENAINRWHTAANSEDLVSATRVVANPIVVLGPKGAGPISDVEFAG